MAFFYSFFLNTPRKLQEIWFALPVQFYWPVIHVIFAWLAAIKKWEQIKSEMCRSSTMCVWWLVKHICWGGTGVFWISWKCVSCYTSEKGEITWNKECRRWHHNAKQWIISLLCTSQWKTVISDNANTGNVWARQANNWAK